MIKISLKLLLLSWAVTAKMENKFEEPEDAISVPPKNEILLSSQSEISPSNFEGGFQEVIPQPEDNRITAEATEPGPHPSPQSVSQQLKQDTARLLQAMEACRNNHPGMSNQTFNLQLYGGLLSELMGVENESSKAVLRHCNISEELVGKLKAKLSQLETFQDVFVLIPRNNSSESPELGKSTQQPNSPASRIHPQSLRKFAIENNLKLKLGDEWTSLEPKLSHLSHIYLGSSIYPILTEESRVLEKEQTNPGPSPTEDSLSREVRIPSAIMNNLTSVLQTASSQNAKPSQQPKTNPEILFRLPRSLQKKSPDYLESDSETIRNRLLSPSTDAPRGVYIFPKKSHRWHAKDDDHDRKGIKCPQDLKEFGDDPRYQMIYKLCSAILQHFRKFLKAEMSKQRMKSQD